MDPTRILDFDGLQQQLWSFAAHRVITVAARSGMLTLLAQRDGSAEEVAAALELDPLATGKMLRALCALGLLRGDQGRFAVVDPLRPHFTPGPDDLVPFIEHSHVMYERWGENLETWLRGQPWQSTQAVSPDPGKFGAAMQAMGSFIAQKVVAALDLRGVERMLDIGGGFGHYARTFCRARSGLQATVVDRPEVVELGRQQVATSDLAGRVEFIGGDYLEVGYGQGYDLALLANVLHQESAERAADLVRRATKALTRDGRLVVLDFAIDDARQQQVLGALFAINMRSFGDTYPEPTLRAWFKAAGLRDVQRIDLPPHRWLIVGHKP